MVFSRSTIVVPCFNEAKRLPLSDFREYLSDRSSAHLLLVDDGSTDGTREMLLSLSREFPGQCTTAAMLANSGKAEAVRAGLLLACDRRAAHIGYWDADLAAPLNEIPDFQAVLRRRADVDVVLGSRRPMLGRDIARLRTRAVLSSGCRAAVRRVLRAGVYDTQCGAKLFRVTELLRRSLAWPFMSRWLFDVELLLRLQRLGGGDGGVWFEQPLHRWSEKPGSKIKPSDYWRALADLRRLERLYADRASAERVEQDGLMQPLRPIVVIAPGNAIAKRRAA